MFVDVLVDHYVVKLGRDEFGELFEFGGVFELEIFEGCDHFDNVLLLFQPQEFQDFLDEIVVETLFHCDTEHLEHFQIDCLEIE